MNAPPNLRQRQRLFASLPLAEQLRQIRGSQAERLFSLELIASRPYRLDEHRIRSALRALLGLGDARDHPAGDPLRTAGRGRADSDRP